VTCPSCSAEVPAGARFCPSCGHALLAPTDERRVVTVLFGDLVGFTALSESRDPEQVKNLVDRCFERLAADITSYGGRVDKIVGDAVVALFGAPVAHEDDAERAVRAGLAMQRTLAEQAATLGAALEMRVGVNTGEVLVGALRAGGDYTAMGDVVNTASRLQTLAEPGQVVVGPETHAATEPVFRFEPLGELQPRGREQKVPAWVALEAVTSPGRRPRRSATPLVGRDAEVKMMCAALTTAFTYRRPHLALVIGEAGLGKSRLAEAVARDAVDDHGALLLVGRSLPYGEANVWWPVAEAVRQACLIEPTDDAAEAREKCVSAVADAFETAAEAPEVQRTAESLMWLLGEEGRLGDIDPGRAHEEVVRAVRSFLEGLASQRPVVVALSDVQWADQLVLDLVDHLLDRLHRIPLVVLLTARPELEERWRPTPGRHNLVILNLDALDTDSSAQLLEALLGSVPDPELRDALVERSGGNPFFLEELVALLHESGALRPGGAQTMTSLPATLRGIVAARLDSLGSTERAVIEDAAVLGRRGPVAALEALAASRGEPSIARTVDALMGRDLLVVDDDQCEFASDIIREVAYSTLTKAERARRHAILATWLDSQATERERADEFLEELARHYALAAELVGEVGSVPGVPADVTDIAMAALQRAAERAEDREIHRMSERLFDQQLRLVGHRAGPDRRHALIGRARARAALRRDELALLDLTAALDEAREADDDVAVARALTVRGDVERNRNHFEESLASLAEAVEVWRRVGDRRGEASALRRQGMTNLFSGELRLAEDSLRDALAAFEEIGARKGVAWAQQNLAWIAFIRGRTAEADERLDDAIQLFFEIGDWGGRSWAFGLRGWVRYSQGLTAEAEVLAQQVLEDAQEQEEPWGMAMMMVLLASVRLWQGRATDAIELATEARRRFEAMSDRYGLSRALAPLSRGLLVTGRRQEAADVVEELTVMALTYTASTEDHRFPALLAAELDVHAGEGQRALDALVDAGFADVSDALNRLEASVSRGMALAQTGRAAEGVALLEQVLERVADVGPRANVLCMLALARAAAGQVVAARQDAEEVLALDGGTYLDRVMALLALACASARLGETGEALDALARADTVLRATDDVLSRGIVALARARVLGAAGDSDAGAALTGARARLDEVGVEADGWDEIFRAATGVSAEV
jgi:class 3 adenylate cyclase/tetratricopeptide (TPR) repeat protein